MKKMEFRDVKTQREAVIWHLQNMEKITSWEAIKEYGVTRLSSIIFNLREEGFNIQSKPETMLNRFGNSTTIAVYHLLEKGELEMSQIKLF